ncbi:MULTISPECIES: phage tail protein [unclassified Nonomuraea]|uniref:phage tail protein n=1 Tax=unclassified Nonomuraea TaxID=2593643 RepID=UPI0033EC07DF
MRLLDLTATPHSSGNRIDLAWRTPEPDRLTGVRVMRRRDTHPTSPSDGELIAEGLGLTAVTDCGLHGETVYYYTLFPFDGGRRSYEPDPGNKISAMALSRYDFAQQMYDLLPALYHRYDAEHRYLRRFLDLPGSELDRLYSIATAMLSVKDLRRVDGALLPLLAQWIGWPTDRSAPVATQRNEVRQAARLYQTIGTIAALDATVARVTRWTGRTKEFTHNVARTNQPERLNLWSARRDGAGQWLEPGLTSVNFAYDGRPAAVREPDGSVLVFYHTYRRGGWDLWAKRLRDGQWEASRPVVEWHGMDQHPAVARQRATLWLFWESYDPVYRGRYLSFSKRSDGTWTPPQVFMDQRTDRHRPAAVSDAAGGVWLFWLEPDGIRYNRHDGADWELSEPGLLTAGDDLDDLFALMTDDRLWLFWTYRDTDAAGRTWSSVAYRSLDLSADEWSPVYHLPKTGHDHDRQPAARAIKGGIELFWSTTRHGGWSISRNTLTTDWGEAEQVGSSPATRRAPLPVDLGADGTLLLYRSNQSVERSSAVFGATRTLDHRYAGTTTVDTTAKAKLALRGSFADFQTYLYDNGRTNADRIADDTIGVFLTPPRAVDPDQAAEIVTRLGRVLADFVPVTTRPVFIWTE